MADSAVPYTTLRFPRLRLQGLVSGYRSARECGQAAPVRDTVVPPQAAVDAGGSRILLRPAGPGDTEAARALHGRCSPRTLSQRYQGPAEEADRYLPHLLSPRHGYSVAAGCPAGTLVALGHLLRDGDETEVALLVEDTWQRRGIGAALLRTLIGLAEQTRCETVYAVTRASNTGMIATMRGTGMPLEHDVQEGMLVLTARLTPRPAATALRAPAGG